MQVYITIYGDVTKVITDNSMTCSSTVSFHSAVCILSSLSFKSASQTSVTHTPASPDTMQAMHGTGI